MSYGLYIGIGAGLVVVLIIVILIFRKRRKDVKHPLISRSKELMVTINQRIFSLNSRIQQLDDELTKLLAADEKKDLSFIGNVIALEEIPDKIERNKREINSFIADVKDLQDYKNEIEEITSKKNEQNWEELERVLDLAKEKLQYRYV